MARVTVELHRHELSNRALGLTLRRQGFRLYGHGRWDFGRRSRVAECATQRER